MPYTYDGIELLRSTLQAAEPGAPVMLDGASAAMRRWIFRSRRPGYSWMKAPAKLPIRSASYSADAPIRFGGALKSGVRYMVSYTGALLDALKDLVFHGDGHGGLCAARWALFQSASHEMSTGGAYSVVNLIFILSLNIGIMNLLPLPALDGGRLVFLIIEAIRRKPVPPEKEGLMHAIGSGTSADAVPVSDLQGYTARCSTGG